MLVGTRDLKPLARRAPRLERFDTEALELGHAEALQLAAELEAKCVERLYPPALHPTLPPMAVWQVIRCREGALGSFAMAILRLVCRSGVRPRGFVVGGVIDSPSAATALASRFGYPLRLGEVRLRRGYDEATAAVALGDRTILELAARDLEPLSPNDLQHTAAMHLAHTPNGLRLVQVEPEYRFERAERGTPILARFDPAEWDEEPLRPTSTVSAWIAVGLVSLPAIRYVCRPDVLAFDGTERVQ